MSIKIKNDETNTRQTIPNDPRHESPYKVSQGYDFPPTQTIELPPCGLYDADEAVINLFRNHLDFDIKEIYAENKQVKIDKPQVFFSGGDRFALGKAKQPPIDKSRNLILPAINIRKTDISFAVEEQKRGISDKAGNLVIKRRISDEFDRDYQNIINKLGLRNLQNLPTTVNEATSIIEESAKDGLFDPIIKEGGLLQPNIRNNVYEVLYIPIPKFFLTTYEITFWTSHISHMNYMIETVFSSMLAQEKAFKLVTKTGYWFMGMFDDQARYASNFEEYKEDVKLVKYNFTMKAKGFMLPPQHGFNAQPVRRWVFAPKLSFDVNEMNSRPHSKEALLKQNSIESTAEFSGTNPDGIMPLFSLQPLEDQETKQTPTLQEKTVFEQRVYDPVSKTSKIIFATEKTYQDNKNETVTSFSSKEAFEKFKFAAYQNKKGRK